MKSITLSKTRRLASGHLWVFSNELAEKLTGFTPGELVEMHSRGGEFLATGYVNPHTLIAARVLARKRVTVDRAFLLRRIQEAVAYRRRLYPDLESCRLVFAEGDLLPGLIIDKYDRVVVIQILTAGMETMTDTVVDVVAELLDPQCIILRNDSAFRELEGLARERRTVAGELRENPVISEGGLRFEVDPLEGQKTGFFLDQRENRLAFAALHPAGRALDLFAYTGAWGMHLANRGCEVQCVDSSAGALAMAEANAGRNGLKEKVRTVRSEVAPFLRRQRAEGQTFDVIVLDPPAFAKSKANVSKALRAYSQVNTAAMLLLRPGGLLATASCSYHIPPETFLDLVHRAATAAGRQARLIEFRAQARDHPALVAMPETRYLKCALVQVL